MISRSLLTRSKNLFLAHKSIFMFASSSSDNLYRLNHKDWLSPSEVLNIFSRLKDPESVISVLNQYSNRKDYKPTEALYTLVINQLARSKSFDSIEDVMERIKTEKRCRLSEEFFFNVMKIYGNMGGRIKKVIQTLFDMPNGYDCWPSIKTFNFVLNLLVSAKLFDVVHDIYRSAPKLGIEIDACCLNILVKGLCENGNVEAAFYVLDEFPKQNFRPNVRTFSTLMHALCKQDKLEEAFGLFEKMERDGVDVDTITFNILISGLRKKGRVDEAIAILKRMKEKGCYPNAGSYQEVLYGLIERERFAEANEVMATMISEGMGPSFESYKKLIHGFCADKLIEDVDRVLKQMVRQGFVPKMGMWREIVKCVRLRDNVITCIAISELVDGNTS